VNPTYYGVEDASNEGVKEFLNNLIADTLTDLAEAGCVEVRDNNTHKHKSRHHMTGMMMYLPP